VRSGGFFFPFRGEFRTKNSNFSSAASEKYSDIVEKLKSCARESSENDGTRFSPLALRLIFHRSGEVNFEFEFYYWRCDFFHDTASGASLHNGARNQGYFYEIADELLRSKA
jgi:hypothetical protein